MANITATSRSLVGELGILRDTTLLRKTFGPDAMYFARLNAFLLPPASGTVEALLAYQHQGDPSKTFTQFARSAIVAAGGTARWVKRLGTKVDITKFVRLSEPLVLRVLGQVNTGTGQIEVAEIEISVTA